MQSTNDKQADGILQSLKPLMKFANVKDEIVKVGLMVMNDMWKSIKNKVYK